MPGVAIHRATVLNGDDAKNAEKEDIMRSNAHPL